MDLGSHTLDILDFMLGPLVDVAGTAVNRSGSSNSLIAAPAITFGPVGQLLEVDAVFLEGFDEARVVGTRGGRDRQRQRHRDPHSCH